jgi:hypothetical protein
MTAKSVEFGKGLSVRDLLNKNLITVDRIIQIARIGRSGEYVMLNFSLFGEKEEIVKTTYSEYLGAVQSKNEALTQQVESKFLKLTGCSAPELYIKARQTWFELGWNMRPTS